MLLGLAEGKLAFCISAAVLSGVPGSMIPRAPRRQRRSSPRWPRRQSSSSARGTGNARNGDREVSTALARSEELTSPIADVSRL